MRPTGIGAELLAGKGGERKGEIENNFHKKKFDEANVTQKIEMDF